MVLQLVPVTLADAKLFVGVHHKHNLPPVTWRFGVGIEMAGEMVGVGMAGNPKARKLQQADPHLLEIIRVTTPRPAAPRNVCSMLYGALCRAGKALGYRRVITYTLQEENGASLRASGFRIVADLAPSRGWDQPSRHRVEVDLFGNERTPDGPKYRWERRLAG